MISAVQNYSDALKAYKPAQFVPDTPLDNAPKITALNPGEIASLTGADAAQETAAASDAQGFGQMVKGYMDDLNNRLESADHKTNDLMTGKTHDTGAVVTSVEEADLSMQFALAMRSKLTAAYQSIEQITY